MLISGQVEEQRNRATHFKASPSEPFPPARFCPLESPHSPKQYCQLGTNMSWGAFHSQTATDSKGFRLYSEAGLVLNFWAQVMIVVPELPSGWNYKG